MTAKDIMNSLPQAVKLDREGNVPKEYHRLHLI